MDDQCPCLSAELKERRRHKTIIVITIITLAFIFTIFMGTLGYVVVFNIPWIDAFYNASLIITGLDAVNDSNTTGQKLFVILYSLFSAVLILSLANAAVQRLADLFVEYD